MVLVPLLDLGDAMPAITALGHGSLGVLAVQVTQIMPRVESPMVAARGLSPPKVLLRVLRLGTTDAMNQERVCAREIRVEHVSRTCPPALRRCATFYWNGVSLNGPRWSTGVSTRST